VEVISRVNLSQLVMVSSLEMSLLHHPHNSNLQHLQDMVSSIAKECLLHRICGLINEILLISLQF